MKDLVLLCVMDGFGLRDNTPDNAIAAAHKPNYEKLIAASPHTKIDGSGIAVGLPEGQMGNSEVGHLNLGAGRVVYQDITRIDKAISDGDFFKNEVLVSSIEKAVENDVAVHLFGLVSDGKVHSSMDHLFALVKLAKERGVTKLYLHAQMDGRDTPPRAGADFMREVLKQFKAIGLGEVATVGGRYYGMDRDRRWERTGKSYDAVVHRQGVRKSDPVAAIEESYIENVTDEFIIPVVIDVVDEDAAHVKDNDLCIMFNFRADRARQMSYMLVGHEVDGFVKADHPDIELVTMTQYDITLTRAKVAFPPYRLTHILGQVISSHGLKQLRTAETEKYAHVTFFFNGGVEQPFEGEERDMIPSPKVATYDLKPEMSSVEVTDNLVKRIDSGEFSFILINYANCDMVGHTGDFNAAKAACEAVDRGLGRIIEAVERQNGVALVTADHGNAEIMIDPATGGPWTAHTTNLVPFIVYDPCGRLNSFALREGGILADVAPTVLDILDIEKPAEMTGRSLIKRG